MPIYTYKHPETGEEFDTIRPYADADKVFKAPDGKKCVRVKFPSCKVTGGGLVVDKNAEVWEKDAAFLRKMKPKYVRRQDGRRERYDPNRHC